MKQILLPLSLGCAVAGGLVWSERRILRNHDAAMNQLMYEIWENPERDYAIPLEENPRYQECENYLERGLVHMLLHEPPLGALERFEGITLEEYNAHCIQLGYQRFYEAASKLQ